MGGMVVGLGVMGGFRCTVNEMKRMGSDFSLKISMESMDSKRLAVELSWEDSTATPNNSEVIPQSNNTIKQPSLENFIFAPQI